MTDFKRSSFDRVGHVVGRHYTATKTAIDVALIVALEIPPTAQSVSFGIDRVSLPPGGDRRGDPSVGGQLRAPPGGLPRPCTHFEKGWKKP